MSTGAVGKNKAPRWAVEQSDTLPLSFKGEGDTRGEVDNKPLIQGKKPL